MLQKLGCQKVCWKFQCKAEPLLVRHLSEPNCQRKTKCWYLLYRWFVFLCWSIIITFSIFEFGVYFPSHYSFTWLIYLTDWDLILGTCQALLGATIVSRRWKLEKTPNFDANYMQLGIIERIYWFLYITTSSMAVGVTAIYWITIYNPKEHSVDPLNVMTHICNAILVLLDVIVANIPFKMRNFWWCPVVSLLYLIFSYIYYVSGGKDAAGHHYIYKILDWENPKETLLFCTGGLIFIVLVHMLFCVIVMLRDYISERCVGRNETQEYEEQFNGTNVTVGVYRKCTEFEYLANI